MKQITTKSQHSIRSNSLKFKKLIFLIKNSKINPYLNINEGKSSKLLKDHIIFKMKDSLHSRMKEDKFLNQPRSPLSLSKDLSLYFSLIEKPINLLFSVDQFLFEFSKKTYQQKKTGEFLQQLKERKKFSLFYGHLTRKQFVTMFKKIQQTKGFFSRNFLFLLERRLDVVLYRSGIVQTIAEAGQLINHKKILVNSHLVTLPSFFINPGDVISLTSETKKRLSQQLVEKVKIHLSSFPIKKTTRSRNFKIFQDFFLKLNFVLEKSLKNRKMVSFLLLSKKEPKKMKHFSETKLLCKFLIQLVCTKMKLRGFFNIKKNFIIPNSILESILLEKQKISSSKECHSSLSVFFEKSLFISLTQKSNSIKKEHFASISTKDSLHSRMKERSLIEKKISNLKQKKSFIQFKENQQKNIYANLSSFQKRPMFWRNDYCLVSNEMKSSDKFDYKWKTEKKSSSFYLKDSLVSFRLSKKNIKGYEKEQLTVYRQCFLFFLKHLENHTNFLNLIMLNVKKSFLKKEKSKLKKNFLTFRKNKPLNIEVSYNLLNMIYLYSPQRLNFPFFIDLDLIYRSLR